MRELSTTVAVYPDVASAETDWFALEQAAREGSPELVDAALVENRNDEALILKRQSRHGWGKGAVVGAVVAVLFPPSLIGAATVGAAGGALIARMTRGLGRGEVKDLGEVMDAGLVAIVVVAPSTATDLVNAKLTNATKKATGASSTAEEVEQALSASGI
jgi:uncharacterized membrane protein